IEEREPIAVDADHVLMFDDWRLDADGQVHGASFGAIHDRAHGGRLGNTFTLNGTTAHAIPTRSGARLRLRLINVANANVFAVRIADHKPTIIAVDGQPVTPRPATDGLVLLGPGQRADVIVDAMSAPGTRADIQMVLARDVVTVGSLAYSKDAPLREAPSDAPIALKANPIDERLDLANAVDVAIPMDGGAMGRMRGASINGDYMSMRELVREMGYVWALAGQAGMPKTPLFAVKRGQTVRLTFQNNSMWPHAMHVHGHHFKEVGDAASEPWWRDTIMLFRQQKKTVAFVADNPGKWMLHCHMLEHHEGGMGTWFEVTS
ncbi:MAG: multicopper oxidase domain-containing protein, partial [Pseudomonadota bacterium]